jgi:hypothetical protein
LPLVVASEKVMSTKEEQGQQKLDVPFATAKGTKSSEGSDTKRRREVVGGDDSE